MFKKSGLIKKIELDFNLKYFDYTVGNERKLYRAFHRFGKAKLG